MVSFLTHTPTLVFIRFPLTLVHRAAPTMCRHGRFFIHNWVMAKRLAKALSNGAAERTLRPKRIERMNKIADILIRVQG